MYDDRDNRTSYGGYYDTGSSYVHYDSSGMMDQPKKKKKGKFARIVAKCVILSVVFGSVSSAAFMATNYLGRTYFGDQVILEAETSDVELSKTNTPSASAASPGSGADVYDVSGIVDNCMPSVVSITNIGSQEFRTFFGTYEQESQSSGSGIIIGQNETELLIVTNNHVISNAKEISVYFNSDGEAADENNVISAKVKGTEPSKDLAVIAVRLSDIPQETREIIKIATIGDSRALKIGEPVVAIGNAYGYGLSVTSGIVSALNREVSVQADGQTITNKLIQTDAAINPGNSGGALLNGNGELIGINSVKFISEEVEGMGYAIPITDVESIIGDLMNKVTRDQVAEKDRGYLGITGVDVTEEASINYGMPVGTYVSTVVEGGAAERAGIRKGDIITKLDGSSISGMDQLKAALSYYSAGETVPITIQRKNETDYTEITLNLTLISAKEAGVK
ncbi:MAG: trypsin-like peptidase domain-containing protein [Lachnospiraceae bacterium]|nr:trypsin-like peptidase domain-containing protein [Lachnospiraceae bacterium]